VGPREGAEEWTLSLLAYARGVDICVEVTFQRVVHWHLAPLAALLVQAKPPTLVLWVVVFNPKTEGGADSGERVDRCADQRPITQTADRIDCDRIGKLSRFVASEHWLLAALHNVRRSTNGAHSEVVAFLPAVIACQNG
jgi:hypothetical protein